MWLLLDVNLRRGGLTALHLSCRLGLPDVVTLLAENQADLTVLDNDRSLLYFAASSCPRPVEIVSALTAAGLSFNALEPGVRFLDLSLPRLQ